MGGWGQRLWGYENDWNRHFSTVACCLNGPWAGKKEEGKSGSFIPAFLSERETFASSMCNNWNKEEAHRWFLNEGRDLGASWFTTTICGADIPFLPLAPCRPVSLLAPRWSPVGAAYSCLFVRKALQSPAPEMGEEPVSSLASCIQDAPPPPPEAGPRPALLSAFPHP